MGQPLKKYAKFVEKCYNINAEHMENPLINICGNSRAAEEMYQSFKYQNKEVLSHTIAFTFGGYKMLSRRDGLEAAFNHVNPDDPVSKMCGRYHMSEYQDEIFHTDYRSSGPFKHLDAHLLMSPGYQKAEDEAIDDIKEQFLKRGVAL